MVDIAAEDLHPDAGVQYIALDLLDKANKKGLIIGRFPRNCLTDKERELVRRILRDKSGIHQYTDLQIAGAIRWAITCILSYGYEFECDIKKMIRWYRGED